MSDATSGGVPSTDCMKVGTMMFMAKMVRSDSMFATTPRAKGRTHSGSRLMSGSSSLPWRRTNSTSEITPMIAAIPATKTLPENAVDTP